MAYTSKVANLLGFVGLLNPARKYLKLIVLCEVVTLQGRTSYLLESPEIRQVEQQQQQVT
ncbi:MULTISPECIES: hypothetical protein [unclassified Microcoleus]|uniref:hypothetical protein n=1 Tax=unclassified Microcoleus TaxID=2642155 RepID=UPI002FD5F870